MESGPSIACITREGQTIYVSTRMIDFSNFIKEKVEGKIPKPPFFTKISL